MAESAAPQPAAESPSPEAVASPSVAAGPASSTSNVAASLGGESSPKPSPRKRRSLLGRLLSCCLWLAIPLGIAGWFLPEIASYAIRTPWARDWLRDRVQTVIEIGEAPLEWNRPVSLKNVTVKSLDGRPIATAATIQTRRSFRDLLFGDRGELELELSGIRLTARIPEPRAPTGRIELTPIITEIQQFKMPIPEQPVTVTAQDVSIDFQSADGTPVETWQGLSFTYRNTQIGGPVQTVELAMPTNAEFPGQGAANLKGTWTRTDSDACALEGTFDGVSLRPFAAWVERLVGPDNRPDHAGGTLQGTLTRHRDRRLAALLHLKLSAPGRSVPGLPAPGATAPSTGTLLEVGVDGAFDAATNVLKVSQFSAVAEGAQIHAQGQVSGIGGTEMIDVAGRVEIPERLLVDRLDPEVRSQIELENLRVTQFTVTGPLQPLDDGTSLLNVGVAVGWTKAAGFGLTSSDGEVRLRVADGLLVTEPVRLLVNDGRVAQLPRVDLRTKPTTLTFDKGPLLENMLLSERVCRGWMKYVAPGLANAVSTDGRFSVDSQTGFLSVGESQSGKWGGTLKITRAQVRPGPLANQFLGIANMVGSLIPGLNAGEISSQPLLTIQDEVVNYRLENGRVHHDEFGFTVNKVRLSTSGSVGLDETLDLVLSVNLPMEWFAQRGPLLKLLAEEKIQLRVTGTLDAPRIDTSPLKGFGQRIGVRAGAGLLDRIFGGDRSN